MTYQGQDSGKSLPTNFVSEDHKSITGPAAYLADLLVCLGQVTLENGGTFLSKLLDRRPDLEYLELSHANNNISLAYTDLVNEVMEAYIYSKLLGQHADRSMLNPIAASSATDQFLQLLDHVKTQVHERAISAAVYPATVFPYNQAVDRTRHLLAVMGTNLADLRVAVGNCRQVIRKRWPSYQSFSNTNLESLADQVLRRSIATETLGLLEEDLIAITGEGFETEIYQSAFPPEFPSNSPRHQGVACYWGYTTDEEMLNMDTSNGLTHVLRELVPRTGLSLQDIVEVLRTQFIGGRLILIAEDGGSVFSSDPAKLRLCSSTLISPQGTLTQQVCNDLQAFLRLRRKLGWSTNLVDATLGSLVRCTESSNEGISAAWVEEFASIKRLSELCQQDVARLLPLWADMDTNGPGSLYARLFLIPRYHFKDNVFRHQDAAGRYLGPETKVSIEDVANELMAAMNVNTKEFSELLKAARLYGHSTLTMASLSQMYRIMSVSQIFDVPLQQYTELTHIFLESDLYKCPSSTLNLYTSWKRLMDAGWTLWDIKSVVRDPASSIPTTIEQHTVMQVLKLDFDEIQFFGNIQAGDVSTRNGLFQQVNLQALTRTMLAQVCDYVLLRDQFGVVNRKAVLELLKWFRQRDKPVILVDMLATLSGWSKEQLEVLFEVQFPGWEDNTLVSHLQEGSNLFKLLAALRYLDGLRLGSVSISQLSDLALPGNNLRLFAAADSLQSLLNTTQTNTSADQSTSFAMGNAEVRDNQRTALVSYLLQHKHIINLQPKDADALFECFLIDGSIDALAKMSRIQHAISAVQFYVQRCLLGLEKRYGVENSDLKHLRRKWTPLKTYKIWEANRKISLHPENSHVMTN